MKRRDLEFICPTCGWYTLVLECDKEKWDTTKCRIKDCNTKLVSYNHNIHKSLLVKVDE